MIGSRRNIDCSRITCMVRYPSISGIMISISTMARLGVDSTSVMASRPVVAASTCMPRRSSTLDSAKILRASSSTSSTVRPTRSSSELLSRSSMRCFSGGRLVTMRCRNSAVSSSRRSGNSTPLTTMLRAIVCSLASSSADNSRPVNTTTGTSASVASARSSSKTSKPDMSGKRRSSTTQSQGSCRSSVSASEPDPVATISMSS